MPDHADSRLTVWAAMCVERKSVGVEDGIFYFFLGDVVVFDVFEVRVIPIEIHNS